MDINYSGRSKGGVVTDAIFPQLLSMLKGHPNKDTI